MPTTTPFFYQPVTHTVTPEMRSPEFVQISTAAAITIGLTPGKMYRTACTHCLNILVTYPEGCRANCSYCGLARHREEARDYADRNFIRVDWPTVKYAELMDRLENGDDQGQFQRMCISMITHPESDRDTFELLEQWQRRIPHIPVSILSNPTSLSYADLQRMNALGADIFTVALDAVTPAIFDQTRGRAMASPHRWEKYWQVLCWAAEIFGPERFGAHLICGLGETEFEILTVAQKIKDMGGHNHMFAFFPEQGSMMEDWPAVPMGQWRRVQLARYLIDFIGVRVEQMQFDGQGRLIHFAVSESELQRHIHTGLPFQTSGCPGSEDVKLSACNRPYGDSAPSKIRSFPFRLNLQDTALILKELWL
ncbi:MAG: radical SAM protein [Thiohalomonadales bacterium]